ncbi:MAG: glycoside hydrolase family 25 protein [Candidatus Parabeggiatoa sp.]|nr:glycoside hydrolase family 25 protein [Candidatus Parabeggiatoa sp.]
MNQLWLTAIGKAINCVLTLSLEEATSILKLDTGNDLAKQIAEHQAAIAKRFTTTEEIGINMSSNISSAQVVKSKKRVRAIHCDRPHLMVGMAALLSLTSSGLAAQCCEDTPKWQPSDQQSAHGIDVSYYQGVVKWDDVKQQGINFAFAKATGGNTYTDPEFANNWHSIRAEGVIRGAYHFFYPHDDATTQANHFIATLKGQGGLISGDLPPVLDVEITDSKSSSQIVQGMTTWLTVVEKALGCTPIIYVSSSFANEHLGDSFRNYPLWIANYTTHDKPTLPNAWSLWSLWQYSETGQITGVDGAVDVDKYNGSVASLKNFVQKLCP